MISPLYPLTSLVLSSAAGALTFSLARVTLGRRVVPVAAVWGAWTLLAHAAWRLAPSYAAREAGQSIATALLIVTLFAAIGLAPALVATALRVARACARRGAAWLRALRSRAPEAAATPSPTAAAAPPPAARGPAVTRRSFVGGAIAAAPIVSGGVGALGIAQANARPLEPVRVIRLPGLPASLAGARILQISDVHLGYERSVADIEVFVARMLERGARPDILVLTGDIADDLDALDPALRALKALAPRWGTYACLGNHEYFHDIGYVRRTFERRDIPLLVDEGMRVEAGGQRIWIAGVDDPIVTHGRYGIPSGATEPFYRRGVERAMRGANGHDLRLLLSHRPEGFVLASRMGVDLTLSGHTHGGHVGFTDKSMIERLAPGLPMWGAYGAARSRLYVTSGFGHWFRFRLGCPTEAPWIELQRAARETAPASTSSAPREARARLPGPRRG